LPLASFVSSAPLASSAFTSSALSVFVATAAASLSPPFLADGFVGADDGQPASTKAVRAARFIKRSIPQRDIAIPHHLESQ
jgi:hypothetical protein